MLPPLKQPGIQSLSKENTMQVESLSTLRSSPHSLPRGLTLCRPETMHPLLTIWVSHSWTVSETNASSKHSNSPKRDSKRQPMPPPPRPLRSLKSKPLMLLPLHSQPSQPSVPSVTIQRVMKTQLPRDQTVVRRTAVVPPRDSWPMEPSSASRLARSQRPPSTPTGQNSQRTPSSPQPQRPGDSNASPPPEDSPPASPPPSPPATCWPEAAEELPAQLAKRFEFHI